MKRFTRNAALVVAALAVIATVAWLAVRRREAPVTPTELVPPRWEAARASPMHLAHVGRERVACAECHGAGEPFEARPGEASCARCHAEAARHAHRGSTTTPTTCLTCHVFAAGKEPTACATCHGGERTGTDGGRASHALAQHASGDATCGSCHRVHRDKAAGTHVVMASCTSCHDRTAAHGQFRAGSDAGARAVGNAAEVCTACHAPHREASAARDACAGCHAVDVARAHGAHPPVGVDAGAAAVRAFFTSMTAPHVTPRGPRVAGHEACVTCHAPHDAVKADVRACEGCHGDRRPAAETKAHERCTGCHAPHAPGEASSSCSSCHAGRSALASERVAAHAACTSCHDPHARKASPALACVNCHTNIEAKHPPFTSKTAAASGCVGCHAPHPSSRIGAGDGPPRSATVADVHASTSPHATSAACSSCHTEAKTERGLHAGGITCTKCHVPHDFAPAAPGGTALCAKCHRAESDAVAARAGHAPCGACHGAAHTPKKKPSCGSCHAQETATSTHGSNACTQCHEPHSGSLGTHASCTSCHGEKAKALHGNLANGCASCHRPHGPKGVATPPACGSCHDRAKLPGLHGVDAHGSQCASCHTPHAPPRSDRATCTGACHVDRRNHQPAAQLCKGCHMFRR